MKRNSNLFFLIIALCALNSSCKKAETNDPEPAITSTSFLASITDNNGDKDTLLYNGNRLTEIRSYEKGMQKIDNPTFITKYEYINEDVRIYSGERTNGQINLALDYTVSFKDSKINQVKWFDGSNSYAFFYNGSKVSYIIESDHPERDSVTIEYDSKGSNISKLVYYYFDNKKRIYVQDYIITATYDDKINPCNKSLFFCAETLTDYMDYIFYFNTNNLLKVTYTGGINPVSFSYEYNPQNLPKKANYIYGDIYGNYIDTYNLTYKLQ